MTTRVLIAVAAASLVAAPAAGRDRKYQTVTVGGCAVTLPGSDLRTEADTDEVEVGPDPGKTVRIESDFWEVRDVVYRITVARLPAEVRTVPADVLLDGARAGLVGTKGQGGIVMNEGPKEVRGLSEAVPGREVTVKAGTRVVRARLAVLDGRLCQLTAVGSPKAVESAEVTAALDTFTVLTRDP